MDDPFSGLELISSSPDQKNVLNNTTNDNLEAPNDNNDSDIETAVEADEFLILESGDNSETLTHQIDDVEVLPENILPPETFNIWSRIQGQWWTIGFPLCILLFFQLMPLPTWVRTCSKLPNKLAARLLFFYNFSNHHALIWQFIAVHENTYTLIDFHDFSPPT